jgi:hypothetical protein
MTPDELERQTRRQLDNLRRELAGSVPAEQVAKIGEKHFVALRREAAIVDFIPLLVYRFAKDELLSSARGDLHHAA